MSADPNKKSGRSFQCRDVLWETFEQMARELECSVDYLINEAMKQYARQRSYGGASRTPMPAPRADGGLPPTHSQGGFGGLPPPPIPQGMGPQTGSGMGPPPLRGGPPGPPSQRLPPPPMRSGSVPGAPAAPMRQPQPTPAPQRMHAPATAPSMRNAPPPASRVPPPMRPQTAPTPMEPRIPTGNGYQQPAPPTHGGMLSVFYQGEKLPVTKDRFVIGRGKQSSDLTLKDPNVSRQHAMVEFQNGMYFMVDMGSTNGVEFNGQRIARKQIGEGDSFRICDHEMRFTYH